MENEKRLIDANAAVELLRKIGSRDYRRENGTIADAMKILSSPIYTPTVDVVEVVHGKWVHHYYDSGKPIDDNWYCSECQMCGGHRRTWYCPNCGAKMDGERKDNG